MKISLSNHWQKQEKSTQGALYFSVAYTCQCRLHMSVIEKTSFQSLNQSLRREDSIKHKTSYN